MSAATVWWRVLQLPWQRRRNQGSMWPLAVIALLVVGMAVVPALLIPRIRVAALAVLLGVFLLLAWFTVVTALLAQNEPHAARLVPGHLRTLRSVWAAAWVSITLLAALLGAGFGFGVQAGLGAAALMLVIGWMARWPWLGMLSWLGFALAARVATWPPVRALVDAVSQAWRDSPTAAAGLTSLLLVAGAVVSLRVVLRPGDAAHQRAYRRRVVLNASLTKGLKAPAAETSGARVNPLIRLTGWPYRAWLAHVSAARRASPGSVLPRALAGLGPGLHWSGLAGSGLMFCAWAAALGLAVQWLYPSLDRAPVAAAIWVSSMLLGWLSSTAGQAWGTMYRSRREQALLMLLPGMPRGASLNRPLTQRLLVQFGLAWLFGMLALAALLGPRHLYLDWYLGFGAACLWPAIWMCTDWARMPAPSMATGAGLVIVPVVVALVAAAFEAVLGVPAGLCAGALTVAVIVGTVWRYRTAVRAPTAFPAARMR